MNSNDNSLSGGAVDSGAFFFAVLSIVVHTLVRLMHESGQSCVSIASQGQHVNGPKGESSLMARKRYQEGTLELRGNTWTVRFREDMIQPDGSTMRVETRRVVGSRQEFPTRKLARRRANDLVSRVNRLDYRPIRIATFADFTEDWKLRALTLMKPSTQKAARAHLRIHLVPRFGRLRLDEIGVGAVQGLVSAMAEKGLSRHMILNVLYTFRSALNSARKWGYLAGDVKVSDLVLPVERIRKQPRFFTAEQAAAIIEMASNPWRAIFAVAAMTGLRPGEVLGLAVDHLDFERRLIHVRQTAYYSKLQTPKSRSSIGFVPMPVALEQMLREYLLVWTPNPKSLLFSNRNANPFGENKVVQKRLWPILDRLKIPRCGLHAFRHTHASLLVSAGASPVVAQRQLRHSDVRTTLEHYAHIIGDEQRQAAERVARVLRPDATNATRLEKQSEWLQ
jgi:integrase